ncbi:major intrinsic protein [Sulfolobus islandicus Y.G.57.14]|jgi:Glycerol uptake facilitator and related permeases (Major Intrinsic Protein Family)|uniref:Major intrinsic protein n=2 Tax=Saccharolobus islandicus TaxID=43080 RepID=C3NAM1_SACI7|nr:MIP/aquaporin family protein [Sulfolobus islandicus]ACP44781.1 major intrinsic protein [Sulfolobus islandicus Y.G.57.14]ACP49472.1 major intrinsic protein [Sulfolobus islandicus Y.N.15.51]
MSVVLKDSLWRYFAEFVGTFILILFGDGAIVASTLSSQPSFGFIMVSWGFGIVSAIYAVGPISGAHINPNVTLAFAVTKRIKWVDVIPYIVFQILGAAAATSVLLVWWGDVITRIDPPPFLYADIGAAFFTQYPEPGFWPQYWPKSYLPNVSSAGILYSQVNQIFPLWKGAFAEALMTFLLLLIVVAVTDPDSPFYSQSLAPWAIGIGYVMPSLLFEAQLTGGMINEARSWGPMLALYLIGYRTGAFNFRGEYFYVYGIPDFIGGILGALFWDHVLKPYLRFVKNINKK